MIYSHCYYISDEHRSKLASITNSGLCPVAGQPSTLIWLVAPWMAAHWRWATANLGNIMQAEVCKLFLAELNVLCVTVQFSVVYFLSLRIFIQDIPIVPAHPFRVGSTTPITPTGWAFFLLTFSAKFFQFSANFYLWTCKLEIYLENVILIACKWCILYKYYVNSMVLSCSTCQKEIKECIMVIYVIYVIYAVMLWFQFCSNLRVFFRIDKKASSYSTFIG